MDWILCFLKFIVCSLRQAPGDRVCLHGSRRQIQRGVHLLHSDPPGMDGSRDRTVHDLPSHPGITTVHDLPSHPGITPRSLT